MDIFDDFIEKQKAGYLNDLEALKRYVEEKEALAKRSAAASAAAMSGGGYGGSTTRNPSTGANSVKVPTEKVPVAPFKTAEQWFAGPLGAPTFNPNNVPAYSPTKGALKRTVNKPALKPGAGKTRGAAGGNARSKYAEGTINAKGGMSIVGERGAELRVLNRGDGIIPADITKNLWKWGTIDPERIKSGTTGNIETYNIDVDNVNLPDVTSPEEFISGIKNLALQKAYNR